MPWSLQGQGIPPAGIVADSGILNQEWELARIEQGLYACGERDADALPLIAARFHPAISNPENQPDRLVARGALAVPILHVWNQGDLNECGPLPMLCPLRDGTETELWGASCRAEPMRLAIEALGPGSRSRNLGVCVEGNDDTAPCDKHVVTTRHDGVNTDPAGPAEYNAAVMDWVRARLADG